MVYAQIKDNVVVNIIAVDENTPLDLFAEDVDLLLRVDELEIQPSISWIYDGSVFAEPSLNDPFIGGIK